MSHLQFCYSDASIEFALRLKGGDGACYSHTDSRFRDYCNSTVHYADGIDTV